MNFHNKFLVSLACLFTGTGLLRAVPVFSDNFSSGDVNATDNSADGDGISGTAGWDASLSSGSSTFDPVNDATLGNAGRLDNKGNQTFGFVAAKFASQALTTVGDSLTLTFDFRFSSGPTDSNGGSNLRFGFWNATAGIDSEIGPNYWAKLSTQSTATSSVALFEDSGNGSSNPDGFPGSVFGTLDSAGSGALVSNQARYSAEFSLTKTASGVSLSIQYFNSSGSPLQSALVFEDTVSPFTTFNAIGFRMRNPDNFVIDNVVVDFEPGGGPAPGTISLASTTASVDEDGGMATLTVNRTGGGGAVSIDYATANGTAVAGTDYTTTNGTLTWVDGDTTAKTINVPILDNGTYSGDRAFSVSLSNPTGGASLGSPSSATVTIVEDETTPGTISLAVSSATVSEDGGSAVLNVNRTGGGGAVSIDFTTGDGTAAAGTDYTTTSSTLNWADGDTAAKMISVPILDNGTFDGDRTFSVTLSNPTGGSILGSPSSADVTILEDEPVPPGAPSYVSAAALDAGSIVVMWADDFPDETGFEIERATSAGGPWSLVQTAAADSDAWTDSGLVSATEYFYRVTPLIPGGGVTSAAVSAFTLSPGDDLARMRQNALNFLRAIGADRSSSWMIDSLATLDADAESAFTTIQANGSWTDVDYGDVVPDDTWTIRYHYERLQDMARAWATPGTARYQDTATLDAVLDAVDYIETIVNTSTNYNVGNWWWWQIGIPERYAPALLLVREELGTPRLNTVASTLDYLIGPTLRNGTEGAQNWIWQGTNRIYHGLIASSTASVDQGEGFISDYVVIATPGVDNGIMPDQAFQAHGANVSTGYRSQLATGQYGASFMRYVPQFTFFAEGTGWQLSAAKQTILADYALQGSRWAIFGQFMDISTEGRAYSRDDRSAQNPLTGLMALANTPGSPAQSQAAAAAKRILQDWTLPLPPEHAGQAALVEAMPESAAMPAGVRQYNDSDYLISRQDDWFLSLKMISTRTLIGENTNGENLKGRHLSSGVTWLYTGDEYRLNNVLPTLDHDRLPGTTIEKGLDLSKQYDYLPGLRSFVGNASTGTGGVSAMDFHSRTNFPGESDLEAKKSWFLFGDIIVAVGSGITTTVNKTVETIVNQRPMGAIGNDILVNGVLQSTGSGTTTHNGTNWVHEGGIGYVFPGGANVKIKRATQTGRWSDIGAGSSTLYSNPMCTLYFDHGTMPSSASYAYAMLPQASTSETAAAAGTFQILAQTSSLHAVKHLGENAVGAVFWSPGTADGVSVNAPCVAFWRENGGTVEIALSEPTQSSTTIQLVYPAELVPQSLPPGVSSSAAGGATTVTFNVSAGKNYAATFTLPLSPGEQWRQTWFGQTENTGNAADDFDFDKDGLVNLVERALGTDPTSGDGDGPTADRAPDGRLVIRFTRDPAATDLVLTVRGSDDLSGGWSDLAVSTVGGVFSGLATGVAVDESPSGGLIDVEVSDSDAGAGKTRRFMQVEVVSQ